MKKLLAVFLAVAMIVGFGSTAMAAFDVRTAITSEPITGTPDFCEKYGATTFTFQAGAKFYDGDWFIFDLPREVELCQSFDFVVLGNSIASGNIAVAVPTGGVTGGGTLETTGVITNGDAYTFGPWKVIDLGGNPTQGNNIVVANNAGGVAGATAKGMYVRVTGDASSRRVWFRFYDNDNATSLTNAANMDGNTILVVGGDTELTLTLFDGNPWDGPPADPNTNPNALLRAYTDDDNDGIYGEVANDLLQRGGRIWENYICARVTNAYNGGDLINVSFDSGGISGEDFITFQGQREIAHIIGGTSITLEACAKRDLCGYVSLAGGQGANCRYDYTAPQVTNNHGYCPDTGNQVFTSIASAGNKAILQIGSGTFTGAYYIELEIISGDGTYFGGIPGSIDGMTAANGADPCTLAPGSGLYDYNSPPALTWTVVTRSGTAFVAPFADGAGCGTVPANKQLYRLRSQAFDPTNADINRIVIDIPRTVYNPALLSDGDVATVRVELYKVPCGLIFQDTRCIANYVSTCAAAQPQTTLLYPYAVELDGSSGWWFGMSFCNPSGNAGTATITVYETDGDTGSYTTPSIAAGGMMTMNGTDLLSNLTAGTGNTGTLGDSRAHIVVICNFGFAGGFGMMGNGMDSTGYSANGVAGNVVGNWNR